MTECVLCNTKPIICKETEAYIINFPVPASSNYLRFNSIISQSIKENELPTMKLLTPGARSNLSVKELNELINHKSIWANFLKTKETYGIIFNKIEDAEDKQLSIIIENRVFPKDWDIIMLSDSQYIFNKRSARILYGSSTQINSKLSDFINSFSVLKVCKL